MDIQQIPLSKLSPSGDNVRKSGGSSIDELAASIAAQGLLQNLCVIDKGDGLFEVAAGNRRLRALRRLADEERLPADFTVPCAVFDTGAAFEASLAENVIREAMHPADQFDAFKRLVDEGRSITDIAGRFGVSPQIVTQRLSLARVAPSLVQKFRDDEIDLEQMMAFTVTDDHAAQERYWKKANTWERDPRHIRAALTKTVVSTETDARFRIVTPVEYEDAGGELRRDVFSADGHGFATNPQLLSQLVERKADALTKKLTDEGWSWVEVRDQFDSNDRMHFSWIDGSYYSPPTTRKKFTDEEKASAGAVITIGVGGFEIYRGAIKPEDKRAANKAAKAKQKANAPKDAGATDNKADEPKPLSQSLVDRLNAHRTLALGYEVASNPKAAILAITHALVVQVFGDSGCSECPARIAISEHANAAALVGDTHAARAMEKLGAEISAQLGDFSSMDDQIEQQLWRVLAAMPIDELVRILAFCVGKSIDARFHAFADHDDPAAAQLIRAIGLDMTKWWSPTVASYFGSVSKPRVLEALEEAGLADAAKRLAGEKSAVVAAEAEVLIAGKGWLPQLLREPIAPAPAVQPEEPKAKSKKKPKA